MPLLNNFFVHYFTGRSDNFDPGHNSGNPKNARFDTEGMRISNERVARLHIRRVRSLRL